MRGRIRRQLWGEVHLQATGTQTSRFAALLLKKGIFYRDLRYEKGALFFTISVQDLKKADACAEKSGTHLKVCGETGIPTWWKRYKNRWAFAGAMALCFGMVILSSQRLWTIRIEGASQMTQTEMLARLEEHGIREGMWRWKLDTEETREAMLLAYPDLSWLSLTVEGSCLQVRMAEATVGPGIQSRTQPANMVASKTCIIYSIVTEKGTPKVKQGDVVQEGEQLIQGRVTLKADDGTETYQYVEAKGQVYGKCQYELTEEMEYTYQKKVYGKRGVGLRIYWGENSFSVKNPFRSWENYDTIGTEICSGVGKWLRSLPGIPYIAIEKAEYYPYEEQTAEYSQQEIEQQLQERLELQKAKLLEESQGILLHEEYRLEDTLEGQRAVLSLTVMEEVGRTAPLTQEDMEAKEEKSE